ncbi:TetR family transcriptional regulator [Tabrizicola piscis]|uniref:TetR family transcriptional regulator n=1 Tax=Tabrizicola piscis TaxID=2494374 RepID=A0A3S8U1K1_9RHOB|nr:TetR family transcriptional regulator C-terminal domain-containing protein [Tabrizicola piscis]AZL57484.1 TetR family transcriptional regulator [Tabrizicola piscis]
MPTPSRARSRIQQKNRESILDAALEVFSQHGFRGATLDQIADGAGLSKPNLLYYFPSKEAVHKALLTGLLDTWLDPLRAMDPQGDPVAEVLAYVRRKLDLARDYPRESRLFAGEILQGAPRMREAIEGDLKALVDDKAKVLIRWMDDGRIARVDPVHLIFSIWALTQHYADFDVQVRAVLGPGHDPYSEAGRFLDTLFERLLAP